MSINFDNFNNIVSMFFEQAKKMKDKPYLWKKNNDNFESLSWGEVELSVKSVARSLIDLGVLKGDRVIILSENRPEWMISDLAIMLAGGITVPAYTTYTERDYEYLIDDCNPSVIIVSDQVQYNKIKNIISTKPFIKKIISFDQIDSQSDTICIKDIFLKNDCEEIDFLKLEISRKDVACIIYTSGTQGNPKGVMLSHGGILNNCEGSISLLKEIISYKPKFLTWLPLSHSYEHTVQFVQIAIGAEVYYAESIDKLIKNMGECSPDIMTAVPRFYQNLYQKINSNFNKAKGLKKILIFKMLNLGFKIFKIIFG